jgi:Zn-dependent protease/CBS domain-containing protein
VFTHTIRLGRLLGIPVGVHYSWFIVFVLVTLSLVVQFATDYPGWAPGMQYGVGVLTSVLLFLSVVLHELGHSIVAQRKGIRVRAITLFVFGGVAQIEREPSRPKDEFEIAVAGPVVSVLLAGAFSGFSRVMEPTSEPLQVLGQWLGRINFILAAFNLIPGFPLDGGRILRAILWKATGSYDRGTRLASAAGQGIAYLFIIAGVWIAFSGSVMSGLWMGFIGWFLLSAAQAAVAQLDMRRLLMGVRAEDAMTTDCLILPRGMSVAELVEDHFLRTGRRCALVVEGDRLVGLITLHQVRRVPRSEWAVTPLEAVAIPEAELYAVPPEMELSEVLALMDDHQVNQVPVVRNGRIVGLLGREQLMRVLRTRLELGV